MRSTFRLTSSPARIESLSLFDSAYRYSTVKFCSLNIAKVTQTLSECLLAGLRAEPSARGQISDPRDFTRPFRLGGKAKCKEYSGQSETDKFRIHCFSRYMYLHRITLSAHATTFGGIVRPIYFAVFRLITSSNFVGCSTGRAVGLAPFKV